MSFEARKAKPGQTISVAEADGSITTLKAAEGKKGEWVMRPRTARQVAAADRFNLAKVKDDAPDAHKPASTDKPAATSDATDEKATDESQKEE